MAGLFFAIVLWGLFPAQSPDLAARADALKKLINCACPRENWTRTLESCSDDCASPQKGEIRDLLAAGKSDGEILGWIRAKYGPKAFARADVGSNLVMYVLPFLALVGGAVYLTLRLRARAGAPTAPPVPTPASPAQAALEAEIEEELARIE